MTKHTFALKNVKHAAFASEETECYEAILVVNGKPFCHVSNEGHGGCDRQWAIAPFTNADVDALNTEIKTTYPKIVSDLELDGKPFEYEPDLETICHDLLNDYLTDKELAKKEKASLLFITPDGKVMGYARKRRGVAMPKDVEQRLIAKERANGCRPIHEVPRAEALAAFRGR